jgi:hypothetical protein
MPATPINATSRYYARGLTKIYFLTTVAALATGATRAELDAGQDLSDEVAAIDGWLTEGEDIETPDLGTEFTSKIPGPTSVDDSSLTFYADEMGDDVRSLLTRGTAGFIVFLDAGDVEGGPMDTFPVRVRSQGKARSLDDDAATIEVGFSITREPVENLTVPATV